MSERISGGFSLLGVVAGYSAGAAAWLNLVKDFIGLLGVCAATALSVWALVDKIRRRRAGRGSQPPFPN